MGYVPPPPPPDDPPGYTLLYGEPMSSNELRRFHQERANRIRKEFEKPMAHFEGVDMGQRISPPEPIPNYSSIRSNKSHWMDTYPSRTGTVHEDGSPVVDPPEARSGPVRMFQVSKPKPETSYGTTWYSGTVALWKVVLALGIATCVSGLVYMVLIFIQHMTVR
jgi:hypothetical protein